MHVRCPQCSNPVDLTPTDSLTDIECPSCGSHFHLVSPQSTVDARPYQMANFVLLEQAGFGRFGTVWKARDEELDRIVAVKIPRQEDLDPVSAEAFMREARAAAQLKHPNIVGIHEVGRHEDRLYIVSDFVDGPSLSEWLSGQRLTPREAAELCAALADALHHAHEAGVVHRDLKPGNILLDTAGNPYITDFGLAKREFGELTVTVDGKLLGTPAYMPPEQARGEGHSADRRADVYSLGVILYELLTGQRPFRGEKRMLIHQILHDEPTPPRRLSSLVPRDLETICLKCLEKDPARRYSTAAALRDDLRRYLAGEPIQARPVSRGERLVRWSRRNPAVAAMLLTLFGILVAATAVSTWFAIEANRSAAEAAESAIKADQKANEAADKADELSASLNEKLIREIGLTRAVRQQGYYSTIDELMEQAQNLDRSGDQLDTLRHEMTLAMGDFVGHEPRVFKGFPSEPNAIALSPDGRELAVGLDDGGIWVSAMASPDQPELLTGLAGEVIAVEYSNDGARLTAADAGGDVQVWTREGEEWRPSQSFPIGYSPDWLKLSTGGELLAVIRGSQLSVWDIPQRSQIHTLPTEPQWTMRSAVISPSGKLVAGGFEDKETGRYGWAVWNLETGDRRTVESLNLGNTYENGIVFSGDSRRLAIGFDEALIVYDATDFRQLSFKRLDATKGLAFAPDRPYLVSVDIRGRVTVWNVETGLEVARLNHWGKGTSRNWLTFSGDGRHLAAGNSVAVSVWNLAAADERLDLVGHPAAIPCLAFSPDGSLLVSGGKDAVVNFWNPKTGERLGEVAVPAQIQSLAFSQDSSLLAVGYWTTPGQENQLSLLDPATRRVLAESPSHIGNVNGVAFYDTPEGRFLAVGGNSGLSLWSVRRDAENGGVQLNLEETEPVEYSLHLAASRNGNWVVWNRDRIEVALWDVRQGIIKPLQAPRMHQGWHGLAVFPDSERVIYVNNEGVAEVWNLVQDRPAFQMGGAGEFKTPHVALSRDGRRFAALVDTDVVSVWDTQTQRILYRFRPEEASVWSLAWGRDGQDLAVGRNDGGLAIWKLDRLEQKLQKMGLGSGSGAGNLPKEPAP